MQKNKVNSMHKNLDNNGVLLFSLKVLFHNPILFLPKLIVAILYGFGVLLSVSLAQKVLPLFSSKSVLQGDGFSALASDVLLLLVISIIAFFLDILFSGFYPVIVEQAMHGKVSLSKAFGVVRKKLFLILYSGVLAWVIVGVVSLIISGVLLFFNLSIISWIVSFAIAFGFIFFFYFLFPTVIFKDDTVNSSFRDTVRESFSSSKTVFVYSLIPFAVSIIKFVVAFFSSDSGAMLFYWILVFLTAFIYSIHAIITQTLFARLFMRKNSHFSS